MKRPAGSVLRIDVAPIPSGGEQTPQGFYRFDAVLGRVGVMKYRNADGTIRRELRPPDEVFSRATMQSAWAAVVTDMHPPTEDAFVHPGNVKQYAVGHCGDSVRRDGALMRGSLVVQDGEVVSLIAKGERKELSPGYFAINDATPGRWNGKEYGPHVLDGEEYDVVQRGILYNHVALLPPGKGRQGASVALQLDSMESGAAVMLVPEPKLGDFIKQQMLIKGMSVIDLALATGIIKPADTTYDGEENDPLLRQESSYRRTSVLEDILCGYTDRPSDEQLNALAEALDVPIDSLIQRLPLELQKLDSADIEPNSTERKPMALELITLKLDGNTDVELPKTTAALIKRVLDEKDGKITALETAAKTHGTTVAELTGKLDAANVELTKAKADLAEAPTKLKAAADARAKLVADAGSVLGPELRVDASTTDRQIREQVVKLYAPQLVLDGKDDAYLAPLYDAAIAQLPKQTATSQVMGAAFGGAHPHLVTRVDAGEDLSRETNPLAERSAMVDRNHNAGRPKASA